MRRGRQRGVSEGCRGSESLTPGKGIAAGMKRGASTARVGPVRAPDSAGKNHYL
jgi:hypothetical protein